MRSLDSLGTKIDIAAMAEDVLNAPTKEEAEKRASVDSWGIVGGRYGTRAGVAVAFGEEGFSFGALTPLAFFTVIGGSVVGTYFGKEFGELAWDSSQVEKEGQKWNW